MIWPLFGVIALILVMWAWREYTHDKERKDLYNRLMSRDIAEYKTVAATGKPPPGRARNTILAGIKKSMSEAAGD